MSLKYQYLAKKRHSHRYFEAKSICKFKHPSNYTNCKICLFFTGFTRRTQKEFNKK